MAMVRLWVGILLITTIAYGQSTSRIISENQARDLVRAALSSRTPARLVFIDRDGGADMSGLFAFSAYGAANPNGSSTIGHFLVDPKTGDVWDGVVCQEYKTAALAKLQISIRKKLGLTEAAYQKLKRQGPYCDESK